MTYQEIADMKAVAEDLTTDINDLIKTLNKLTMGDGGILHELKVVVGPDTGLGKSIATLGTSIVQAGESYRNNLNTMVNDMRERAAKADVTANLASGEISQEAGGISSIEFKTVK